MDSWGRIKVCHHTLSHFIIIKYDLSTILYTKKKQQTYISLEMNIQNKLNIILTCQSIKRPYIATMITYINNITVRIEDNRHGRSMIFLSNTLYRFTKITRPHLGRIYTILLWLSQWVSTIQFNVILYWFNEDCQKPMALRFW